MTKKRPTSVPTTPPLVRTSLTPSTLMGVAALFALGTACSGTEEESDDGAGQGNEQAPQANPSGGAPQLAPTGGAPQAFPSGGAPQVAPSGGAPQAFPSGGAQQVVPSGGAPQIPPQPAPYEEQEP